MDELRFSYKKLDGRGDFAKYEVLYRGDDNQLWPVGLARRDLNLKEKPFSFDPYMHASTPVKAVVRPTMRRLLRAINSYNLLIEEADKRPSFWDDCYSEAVGRSIENGLAFRRKEDGALWPVKDGGEDELIDWIDNEALDIFQSNLDDHPTER